ncbi:MAG: ATP-binding protein [Bacteroidota bacterium]
MGIDISKNTEALEKELKWFSKVLETRLKLYFEKESKYTSILDVPVPSLCPESSCYGNLICQYQFSPEERIVLILAIAPHIKPHLLDNFFIKNANHDRPFTEFGGYKAQHHNGFLPTKQTALFLLSGNDLKERVKAQTFFYREHPFFKENILKTGILDSHEPENSSLLTITNEYLNYILTGVRHKPDYTTNFPAKLITTELDWDELILEEHVKKEVMEIQAWIEHGQKLLNVWGLKKNIKPGYRSLFFGPPGTGKTLTASLLGQSAGLDVYRIDLSMVISKYIGETEKNLANVFDQAENKNWILFFDEADALFGKRTVTTSANDRYANQEVAYLLQRIEDFPGIVILATNLKANLDEAFARRFQSMVYFPVPGPEQRMQLWENAFSHEAILEDDITLEDIAQDFEITGGAIINVVRYTSLMALQRGDNTIRLTDLIHGIKREYQKEGKTL